MDSVKRKRRDDPCCCFAKRRTVRYEPYQRHRRKKGLRACRALKQLKCEVKELTRDEAIIVMVESNLQSNGLSSPSEKSLCV